MPALKLDENFSQYLAEIFQEAGHDTETVSGENLSGEPDEVIFEQCQVEGRCIVTLDLDFANIIRFPAVDTPGIIVVRPNRPITLEVLRSMSQQLVVALGQNDPKGCLWILEPGQLRMRKPKE